MTASRQEAVHVSSRMQGRGIIQVVKKDQLAVFVKSFQTDGRAGGMALETVRFSAKKLRSFSNSYEA